MNEYGPKAILPLRKRLSFALAVFWIIAFIIPFAAAQQISLPEARVVSWTLGEALNKRCSVRSFQKKEVTLDDLSWILHTVERMNRLVCWEEGEILVKWQGSLYSYSSENRTLNPAQAEPPSLRMYEAPVEIYLTGKGDHQGFWRGGAGQAIYLGCPALGLGTVTVKGVGFPIGVPRKFPDLIYRPFTEANQHLPLHPGTLSSLESVLKESEDTEAMTLDSWSHILWAAYGFSVFTEQNGRRHRTVPSGHGRYPMEVIAFQDSGVFRYLPETHQLDKISDRDFRQELYGICRAQWIRSAPGTVVIVWDPEEMKSRDNALYEAGAMVANMALAASAQDLSFQWIPVQNIQEIRNLPGIPEGHIPLAAAGAGLIEEKPVSFKDGTYTGEVDEWPEIKVEVVIREGRISKVRILEDYGTPEFAEKVHKVLPGRIEEQNDWDVDGVSGSTLSSNHLKMAVKAALEKAEQNSADPTQQAP